MAVNADLCMAKAFYGRDRVWRQCTRRRVGATDFCTRHKSAESRKHGLWVPSDMAEVVHPEGLPQSYGPDRPCHAEGDHPYPAGWQPQVLLAILDIPDASEPPRKRLKMSDGNDGNGHALDEVTALAAATPKHMPQPKKSQATQKSKASQPKKSKSSPKALTPAQQAVIAGTNRLKPAQELVLADYAHFCQSNFEDWLGRQTDVGERISTRCGDVWVSDLAFYAFFVQSAESFTHLTLHSKFRDLKTALYNLDVPRNKLPAWLSPSADIPSRMAQFFRTSKQAVAHTEDPAREKGSVLTDHGMKWILSLIVKQLQGKASAAELRDALFLWVSMGRSHRRGLYVR